MNPEAMEFVVNLVSTFCTIKPARLDTQEAYNRELSKYDLTSEQWERVYQRLVAVHDLRDLPSLSMIKAAIHDVQAPSRYEAASRRGTMLVHVAGEDGTRLIRTQLEDSSKGSYWAVIAMTLNVHGEKKPQFLNSGMEINAWLSMRPHLVFVQHLPDDSRLRYSDEVLSA